MPSPAPSPGVAAQPVDLAAVPPSPRLARLRAALLAAPYELCTQKAELMTRALELEAPAPGPLARPLEQLARAFAFTLDHMALRLYDDELIYGNPSARRIGAPLHPDYAGTLLGLELDELPSRPTNPLAVDEASRQALRERVLPAWEGRSVLALVGSEPEGPELTRSLLEGDAFVLTQFAGIAHVTPDYPLVARLGLAGIEDSIQRARAALPEATSEGDRRVDFLDAALVVVQAARRHARRWHAHLRDLAAAEPDARRRREILDMGEVAARVPELPARTFREALQAVLLAHAMVHQESFQHGVSFGRVDQYLEPWYRADVTGGRLDAAGAVELLGCFLVKAAELLPLFFSRATEYFSGLSSASGITLAGSTATGDDAANELSHLLLLAYDQVRLRQPNIHVRVCPETSPDFLAQCGRVVARGGGMPAFFNDEAIVPALAASGHAAGDARDYAIVGCAEWGVPGRSFPAAGAGFVSLPYALDLALHEGRREGRQVGPRTSPPGEMKDLGAVVEAFRVQLAAVLERATSGNDVIERVHAAHRPTPFLSALVEGCIASGRDVTAGGAVYNPTGFQGVGLADVVDSLCAIERLVFVERRLSMEELMAAVDADFAGHGPLRARIANRTPRYGEGEAEADRLAGLVSGLFADELARFRNPRGGPYLAGFWTMTTHQGFGRRLGALPSGRRAGEALANGVSPRCGSQRSGPTGALASAAHVVTPANGCILNQTIAAGNLAGVDAGGLIGALVAAFFRKGGAQIQVNVLDPSVLEAARRDPASYRDLVVRISGYSAYFVDLTPEMQQEIVDRAREGIAA